MISIRNSHIRILGYNLLIVNVIIFFLIWIRWYIGIPASILLLIAYYKGIKNINTDKTKVCMSIKVLILIIGLMVAWTLLSGLGGAFPQKNDFHWRNAVLHDLLNYSWPVRYADDSALTYYLALWLVPAMAGKAAGNLFGWLMAWIVANVVYAFYCICILSVVMLLILSYLKATSMKRILLVAIVLIFFSGMDIIPVILQQLGKPSMSIGTHLEWWTTIQYSSNTTQLGWVFNQAIPAWLVTALLLHEESMNNYAFLGLLLMPFGPIPFVGLFFIIILQGIYNVLSALKQNKFLDCFKQIMTLQNIITITVLFPIYYLYYSTNTAISNNNFKLNSLSILVYFIFIVVEFFIYVILIIRRSHEKNFFLFSVIGLFIIPLFTLGNGQDFCMRASIPPLFILMIYIIDYLLKNINFCGKGILKINGISVILIICLSIGAVTPLTEFRQSYVKLIEAKTNGTSIVAYQLVTLGDANGMRHNFVTMNSSDKFFYRYLAGD